MYNGNRNSQKSLNTPSHSQNVPNLIRPNISLICIVFYVIRTSSLQYVHHKALLK